MAVTTVPVVKPIPTTNFNKENAATVPLVEPKATTIKKPNDTMRKNRLQHVEKNKLHVYFFNGQGKPVCSLCQKNFVSMEKIYYHLTGHSDSDRKAFFVLAHNDKKRIDKHKRSLGFRVGYNRLELPAADVAPSTRDYLGMMILDTAKINEEKRYAAETLMLMANGDMSRANAGRKRRKVDDYMEVDGDLEELAADCLVLIANGDLSDVELSVCVEKSLDTIKGGCKVVHAFDLNEAPPMEQ